MQPDVLSARGPGYYRLKLVRGGWGVPCLITHQDGLWQATIDGQEFGAVEDPLSSDELVSIWTWGRQSSEQEYRYLTALRQSAPPDHPCHHPDRPINFLTTTLHPVRSAP